MSKSVWGTYIVAGVSARYGCEKMQDSEGKTASIPLVTRGPIVERLNVRQGRRTLKNRYLSAILISMMIVIPMIVAVGFFATAPARAAGPSAVDLGGAGAFVILAKTEITTTTGTHVYGDMGISPAAASFITGFGLVHTPGTATATSSLVTGTVYASDYAAPTPTTLTNAVTAMQAAYTDAAGRTLPDHTNLGTAGDITGLSIAPGLDKWTTAVTIGAAGVTLSGTSSSDVWIFQISGTLTLASSAHIILTGGANPANIFWQVAGNVAVGTGASMKGIILGQTLIALNTGASFEGRALAQTAVTLQSNTVYTPGYVVPIPEFSQVLIPLIGMMFVLAIVSKVRNQKK